MHNENWDDLRYVLAVAQTGTVSGAARRLGVNHATVLRRIAAFEDRHGTELFQRTPRGYSVPEPRKRVIDAAEEVETAVAAVARIMQGRRTSLSGVVRITATDTFAHLILPGVLAELRSREKALSVEVLTTNEHLDISRLRAEIAIRPTVQLPPDLAGDHAGDLTFGVYGSKKAKTWLGLAGPLERSVAGQWMASHVADSDIAGSADSFVTLAAMVSSGTGRALLPKVFATQHPDLTDLTPSDFDVSVPVWVACHTDLADSPRLRAVRRALVTGIGARLSDA